MKVCVVGGGINGVSSAYMIKKSHPNVDVTLLAKDFSPNTTSDVAAGWWKPFLCGDTPESLMCRWSKETYEYAYNLLNTDKDAWLMGISERPSYLMSPDTEIENPYWYDFVYDYRKMKSIDLERFSKTLRSGYAWTSIYVEGTKYIKYFMKILAKLDVNFVQKEINSFQELYNDFDVIINCAGLGNYYLLDDKNMFPIRGQVIKVKAPWINESVIVPEVADPNLNIYVLPNQEWVILGGTQYENNWNEKPTVKDTEWILRETQKLLPSLKHAEIIETVVGLRPARSSVRVERENVYNNTTNKTMKFIHNYGHGGSGLTIFWGCANDVLNLFEEIVQENLKAKL